MLSKVKKIKRFNYELDENNYVIKLTHENNPSFDESKPVIETYGRIAPYLSKIVDGKIDNSKPSERYLAEELKNKKAILRMNRKNILEAFDKYKTNIIYGIITESENDKISIIEWYQKILDLDESAFENIPEAIKYYLS